jgi:hypothetical protein
MGAAEEFNRHILPAELQRGDILGRIIPNGKLALAAVHPSGGLS